MCTAAQRSAFCRSLRERGWRGWRPSSVSHWLAARPFARTPLDPGTSRSLSPAAHAPGVSVRCYAPLTRGRDARRRHTRKVLMFTQIGLSVAVEALVITDKPTALLIACLKVHRPRRRRAEPFASAGLADAPDRPSASSFSFVVCRLRARTGSPPSPATTRPGARGSPSTARAVAWGGGAAWAEQPSDPPPPRPQAGGPTTTGSTWAAPCATACRCGPPRRSWPGPRGDGGAARALAARPPAGLRPTARRRWRRRRWRPRRRPAAAALRAQKPSGLLGRPPQPRARAGVRGGCGRPGWVGLLRARSPSQPTRVRGCPAAPLPRAERRDTPLIQCDRLYDETRLRVVPSRPKPQRC